VIPKNESDRNLLDHVLECIDNVEEYTVEGQVAFFQSKMIRDACARNLQIMAESTQRLSEAIKSSEREIPWEKIAGFRNFLTHSYFHVDENVVWVVIEEELPALKDAIGRMRNRIDAK